MRLQGTVQASYATMAAHSLISWYLVAAPNLFLLLGPSMPEYFVGIVCPVQTATCNAKMTRGAVGSEPCITPLGLPFSHFVLSEALLCCSGHMVTGTGRLWSVSCCMFEGAGLHLGSRTHVERCRFCDPRPHTCLLAVNTSVHHPTACFCCKL